MADETLLDKTVAPAAGRTDIIYVIVAPGGSADDRQITKAAFLQSVQGSTGNDDDNTMEWLNDAGTVVAYINGNGRLGIEDIEFPDASVLSSAGQYSVTGQTGGGALVVGINDIRDSLTYTLPLAASVPADTVVEVVISDTNSDETPTVEVSGSDDLVSSDGIDADGELLFDSGSSISIKFISNGVDTWEI